MANEDLLQQLLYGTGQNIRKIGDAYNNSIPQQQAVMNMNANDNAQILQYLSSLGNNFQAGVSNQPIGSVKKVVEKQGPNGVERTTEFHPLLDQSQNVSSMPSSEPQQAPNQSTANNSATETTPSANTTEKQQGLIANKNPLGFGGPDSEGNVRDTGTIIKVLQLLAGGGVNNPVTTASTQQQMLGLQPLQKGEKQKMIATAAFDATHLTNESITSAATAFDKVYQTLSGVEKFNVFMGKPPARIKSLSDQLMAASQQQSASFVSRAKAAESLTNSMEKTKGKFRILKVHKE